MPSSEDYTVIWAGVSVSLKATEAERAVEGTHPLVQSARKAGLDSWCDSFDTDPAEGPSYCLLIGKHLATLGYKEGRTKYQLTPGRINRILTETARKLVRFKRNITPKLYVLVHVEDVD